MVDHGGDAAAMVASAAIDTAKTLLNISAGALKQLLLLAREGSSLKSGETNLEKIIKSLDEGDRVSDAKISKGMADKLPELAKKHNVTYAIVENAEGKLIVYYQESQQNRMKNIMDDLMREAASDKEATGKSGDIKENIIEDDEGIQPLKDIKSENEETVVFFDADKSDEYFEIRHFRDKTQNDELRSQIRFHSKDGIEIVGGDFIQQRIKAYENPLEFHVNGYYTDEKLREYMAAFNQSYDKYVTQEREKEEAAGKVSVRQPEDSKNTVVVETEKRQSIEIKNERLNENINSFKDLNKSLNYDIEMAEKHNREITASSEKRKENLTEGSNLKKDKEERQSLNIYEKGVANIISEAKKSAPDKSKGAEAKTKEAPKLGEAR